MLSKNKQNKSKKERERMSREVFRDLVERNLRDMEVGTASFTFNYDFGLDCKDMTQITDGVIKKFNSDSKFAVASYTTSIIENGGKYEKTIMKYTLAPCEKKE